MKTTRTHVVLAALLTIGATGFAHFAWRAHRQRVTLDIQNATLEAVVREVEWQVWEKIRVEGSLAGVRVTLHAKNSPLPEVLDQLAAQAGAYWNKLYAVYRSPRSLQALESALQGQGNLESAGWLNGTPHFTPQTLSPSEPSASSSSQKPEEAPPPNSRRLRKPKTEDPMEMAGQEELVLESTWKDRLGNLALLNTGGTTPASAAATAKEVGGRWTTYYAFHPSNMGIGFRVPRNRSLVESRGSNSHRDSQGDPSADQNRGPRPDHILRPPDPNRRFENLTPEQRVKLAREKHGHGG